MFDKQRGALAKLVEARTAWNTACADAERMYNIDLKVPTVMEELRSYVHTAAEGRTTNQMCI